MRKLFKRSRYLLTYIIVFTMFFNSLLPAAIVFAGDIGGNTLQTEVESALSYEYDPVYEYGDVSFTSDPNIYTGVYTQEEFGAGQPMNDVARYLGALYRQDGSTIVEIEYDGTTYEWNEGGVLKGSNWEDEHGTTLVSVITDNYLLDPDPINVTVGNNLSDTLDVTFILLIREHVNNSGELQGALDNPNVAVITFDDDITLSEGLEIDRKVKVEGEGNTLIFTSGELEIVAGGEVTLENLTLVMNNTNYFGLESNTHAGIHVYSGSYLGAFNVVLNMETDSDGQSIGIVVGCENTGWGTLEMYSSEINVETTSTHEGSSVFGVFAPHIYNLLVSENEFNLTGGEYGRFVFGFSAEAGGGAMVDNTDNDTATHIAFISGMDETSAQNMINGWISGNPDLPNVGYIDGVGDYPLYHTVTFEVVCENDQPIEGVRISSGPGYAITNALGMAEIQLAEGLSHYYVSKVGYQNTPGTLEVSEAKTVEIQMYSSGHVDYDYYYLYLAGDHVHYMDRGLGAVANVYTGTQEELVGDPIADSNWDFDSFCCGSGDLTFYEAYLGTVLQSAGDDVVFWIEREVEGAPLERLTLIALEPQEHTVATSVEYEADFETISDALEVAKPGDTISIVEAGTYTEDITFYARGEGGFEGMGHDMVSISGIEEYDGETEQMVGTTLSGNINYVGRPLGLAFWDFTYAGDIELQHGMQLNGLAITGNVTGYKIEDTSLNVMGTGSGDGSTNVGSHIHGNVILEDSFLNFVMSEVNGDAYFSGLINYFYSEVHGTVYGDAISDLRVTDNVDDQLLRDSTDPQDLKLSFKVGSAGLGFDGSMEAGRELTIILEDDFNLKDVGDDWDVSPADVFETPVKGTWEPFHMGPQEPRYGNTTIELTVAGGQTLQAGQEVVITIAEGVTQTPNRYALINEVIREVGEFEPKPYEFGIKAAEKPDDEMTVVALDRDGNYGTLTNASEIYYNFYDGGTANNVRFRVDTHNNINYTPQIDQIVADFTSLGGEFDVEAFSCTDTYCDFNWDWATHGDDQEQNLYPINPRIAGGNFTDPDWCLETSFMVANINPVDVGEYGLGGDTTDWSTVTDLTNVENLTFDKVDESNETIGKLVIHGPVDLTQYDTLFSLRELGDLMHIENNSMALDTAAGALEAFDGEATLYMTGFDLAEGAEPSVRYTPDSFGEAGDPVILVDNGVIVPEHEGRISAFHYDSTTGGLSFKVDQWSKYEAYNPTHSTIWVSANPEGWGNVTGGGDYVHGTDVTVEATPEYGYEFVDWTEGEVVVSESTEYTFVVQPAMDRTLVANFEVGTYNLVFQDFNETVLQTTSYEFNTDLTGYVLPEEPTRLGYTFTNWSALVPANMPGEDFVITAEYSINQYDLIFLDYNDTELQNTEYNFNADLTEHVSPDPERLGFEFAGWSPAVPENMPHYHFTTTAQYEREVNLDGEDEAEVDAGDDEGATVVVNVAPTAENTKVGVSGEGTTRPTPRVVINAGNADNMRVDIPATNVTSSDEEWDGKISTPVPTEVEIPEVSGEKRTLTSAIQIGGVTGDLTFDNAVRMEFPDKAGERVGFQRNEGDFTEIEIVCTEDNQEVVDFELPADGSCKIDVEGDLVVWTKKFSKFATFQSTYVPEQAHQTGPRTWDVSRTKQMVSGDFNGDGTDSVAMMYDYGRSSMGIWFADFDSSGEVSSLHLAHGRPRGTWDASRSTMVAGDFTGNGIDDIAVMYDYGRSSMGIWIFESDGDGGLNHPRLVHHRPRGTWDASKSTIVSGDFNGNGTSDIAVMYDYGRSSMGIWIFGSDGDGGLNHPRLVHHRPVGTWDASRTIFLAASDFNSNSTSDIVAMYDYGRSSMGLWLFGSDGDGGLNHPRIFARHLETWDASKTGGMVAGDFTGDGNQDVVALQDQGNRNMGLWLW